MPSFFGCLFSIKGFRTVPPLETKCTEPKPRALRVFIFIGVCKEVRIGRSKTGAHLTRGGIKDHILNEKLRARFFRGKSFWRVVGREGFWVAFPL